MTSTEPGGWTPPPPQSPPAGGHPQPGEADERTPAFHDPEEFVVQYLAPHIQRRLGGSHTWCAQWWIHPEGLSRIVAMWTAFEFLRWEGALGMSTWWLHHADPHLAVLMSKDAGPFAACKPDRHSVALPPLSHTPAPAGLWVAAGYAEPSDQPDTR